MFGEAHFSFFFVILAFRCDDLLWYLRTSEGFQKKTGAHDHGQAGFTLRNHQAGDEQSTRTTQSAVLGAKRSKFRRQPQNIHCNFKGNIESSVASNRVGGSLETPRVQRPCGNIRFVCAPQRRDQPEDSQKVARPSRIAGRCPRVDLFARAEDWFSRRTTSFCVPYAA